MAEAEERNRRKVGRISIKDEDRQTEERWWSVKNEKNVRPAETRTRNNKSNFPDMDPPSI